MIFFSYCSFKNTERLSESTLSTLLCGYWQFSSWLVQRCGNTNESGATMSLLLKRQWNSHKKFLSKTEGQREIRFDQQPSWAWLNKNWEIQKSRVTVSFYQEACSAIIWTCSITWQIFRRITGIIHKSRRVFSAFLRYSLTWRIYLYDLFNHTKSIFLSHYLEYLLTINLGHCSASIWVFH